jgi:hypothetical protein
MAKPKPKTTLAYGDHEIEIQPYVVKTMNATLYEAHCVCGWYLRATHPEGAVEIGKRHSAEPDVVYPSVIFALKDAEA